MTVSDQDTSSAGPTPRDEDWEADFDPTYDEKTAEGGEWYGKTDDEIVIIQIQEFNWAEHELYHKKLDDLEGADD